MKKETKKLKFSDLKKGKFIKKKGSSIELKVMEVGKDWRSKKNFVKLYNDVTNYTTTIVDLSDYEKA
jgi:hypothetical protein